MLRRILNHTTVFTVAAWYCPCGIRSSAGAPAGTSRVGLHGSGGTSTSSGASSFFPPGKISPAFLTPAGDSGEVAVC